MFSRFTSKNILRVYPKGTRFTSGNYKPHVGWMHGAQMVAFNMQVSFKYFLFGQRLAASSRFQGPNKGIICFLI